MAGTEFSARHRRVDSEATISASLYEVPWDRQCVLSLDGGGIRGFSSLIILRELMREVYNIETSNLSEEEKKTHSSYEPAGYIPCVRNGQRNTGPEDSQERGCGAWCRYIPAHYFDFVGGTSTGGLISIMLGRLRMSVEDCLEEYKKLSGDIFGHPRWASVRGPIPWPRDKYNGETIQKAVEEVINRRMSLAERKAGAGNFNSPPGLCRTVVFAYASKISNNLRDYGPKLDDRRVAASEDSAPYIFRSYDHWAANPPLINERNPGVAHSVAIWEAARATTAAPFYFDPIKISNRKFGDGGFGNNNPAEEMRTEVACMYGNDPNSIALLLSIGTGEIPISRFEEGPFKKYVAYFNAAKRLASDARTAHERLEAWKEGADLPYYRFNVPAGRGLDKIKLDEWKNPDWLHKHRKSTLETIQIATEEYCGEKEVREELKKVARILVDHRHSRKEHGLWPLVSRGEQYRCTMKKCRMCQRIVPRKEDLEWHLRSKHGVKEDKMQEWLDLGLLPPKDKPKENGAGVSRTETIRVNPDERSDDGIDIAA